MPYRSVRVSVLATKRFGFWKPFNIEILTLGRLETCAVTLFRIQLYDELLVQLDLNQLVAFRQALDAALQALPADIAPVGRRGVGGRIARCQNGRIILAALANRDLVAHLYLRRGNIALAAVDVDVAMPHPLPVLGG